MRTLSGSEHNKGLGMLALGYFLFIFSAQNLQAQCDSLSQVQLSIDTLYEMIDDSTVDPTEFVLSNELVPYYSFSYQQDSNDVRLRVGEFSKNHSWIHLVWCDEKVYNFDEVGDSARWDYSNAALSAISRTRTFTVAGGDTLGFYREMFWYDNASESYNPSRFVSTDQLSYSVELVAASDSSRIALLDTINLRTAPGTTQPCLYLYRPVTARIGYVVPMSVDTQYAFVRVNVASNGSSGSRYMRYDNLRLAISQDHLSDAGWSAYAANVASANNCTQACTFSVAALPAPSRVQITINGGQTAVERIDVVNLNGDVVNSTSLPTGSPYSVNVPSSGLYIVPGYMNSEVVCSRLIFVP